MNKSLLCASLCALALTAPVAAHAYQPGDFIVRAGVAHVDPHEDSSELSLNGNKISGTKASVDSNNQLGLTFAYMLSEHVGVELLAATRSATRFRYMAWALAWTASWLTSSNCLQPCRCNTSRWTLHRASSLM